MFSLPSLLVCIEELLSVLNHLTDGNRLESVYIHTGVECVVVGCQQRPENKILVVVDVTIDVIAVFFSAVGPVIMG